MDGTGRPAGVFQAGHAGSIPVTRSTCSCSSAGMHQLKITLKGRQASDLEAAAHAVRVHPDPSP